VASDASAVDLGTRRALADLESAGTTGSRLFTVEDFMLRLLGAYALAKLLGFGLVGGILIYLLLGAIT
jgi:hypothetical protein